MTYQHWELYELFKPREAGRNGNWSAWPSVDAQTFPNLRKRLCFYHWWSYRNGSEYSKMVVNLLPLLEIRFVPTFAGIILIIIASDTVLRFFDIGQGVPRLKEGTASLALIIKMYCSGVNRMYSKYRKLTTVKNKCYAWISTVKSLNRTPAGLSRVWGGLNCFLQMQTFSE